MIQDKYKEGQLLRCINRTEENHERLTLGKVYVLTGASIYDGNVIYAVKDEAGNMFYSIDRFEDARKPKVNTQEESMEEFKNVKCVLTPEPCEVEPIKHDMVNQPNHYTFGGIETIDFLEAKLGKDGFRGWLKGNILKYMARASAKGKELEDYKKAQFYLNRLIEGMSGNDEAVNRPVTHKQRCFVASLTTKLDLERTNLPEYLSPKSDYHDLTEAECAVLISKLVAIRDYMEDVK